MSRPLKREKIVFSKVVLRQWDGHMQKNEVRLLHYFVPKANSKWIIDLTVKRATPTKFLEENMGANLHDLGLGNDFLDMASKA